MQQKKAEKNGLQSLGWSSGNTLRCINRQLLRDGFLIGLLMFGCYVCTACRSDPA